MSNSLAIAAVTATLRNLIFQGANADVAGTEVTARPLDRARAAITGNQLNLFLYHTALDAALSNRDLPPRARPGEMGHPALPLSLFYLVTAYGANDDDTVGHRLLGRAMSVLHDHPVLGADEVRTAIPNNDLYLQVERIRISAQPLSVDEMYKLWTAFQTQYRISAAYQASVVLIDSTLPARTPVPVLRMGADDRGPVAQATTTPPVSPVPTLDSVALPNNQLSARSGDALVLSGHDLNGASLDVRFSHPRLPAPISVALAAVPSAHQLTLPVNLPPGVPAGVCTVAAVVGRGVAGNLTQLSTNELPLVVAAQVTNLPLPPVVRDASGSATINLQCAPPVFPEQTAYLLAGDRQVLSAPHPALSNGLTFVIPAAQPGVYLLRLRIDGVDTLLVDRSTTPPSFDPSQTVTIA